MAVTWTRGIFGCVKLAPQAALPLTSFPGWGKELVKFLGVFPEPSAKYGAGYATQLSTAPGQVLLTSRVSSRTSWSKFFAFACTAKDSFEGRSSSFAGLEDLCVAGPWGAPHAYQSWSSILRAMRSDSVLSNDEARSFINIGDAWPHAISLCLAYFHLGQMHGDVGCKLCVFVCQETNFNAWLPLTSGEAIPLCTIGLQEHQIEGRSVIRTRLLASSKLSKQ